MSKPRAHIITASAGAGKTYRLAYKYILDALSDHPGEGKPFRPDAFEHTLAVTFTNKATQEMKSRILERLNELATGKECDYTKDLVHDLSISEEMVRQRAEEVRSAILHNYSRFAIMTNDTFFQRIMRALVREIGIEPNYAVELDPNSIISRAADAIISEINDKQHREQQQWVLKIMEQNIALGNTWNTRAEILRLQRELFKEQGDTLQKISSKEELERIVGYYMRCGEKQLAEWQKMAADIVEEIESRDYLQYFKGKSRGFITYFWRVASNASNSAMSNTVRRHLDNDVSEWCGTKSMPSDFMEFATRLQKSLRQLTPYHSLRTTVELLKQNYHSFALMNDLYNKTIDICNEENLKLLSETKQTIGKFIAESDVPFIYEKIGNTFERFMIDEFQDTSLREWHNFLPLLRNALSQSIDISVLLVGDIKQSIYRWRGSDWNILGSIAPNDISQGGVSYRHETLDGNYRSLPKIVEFNNMLFAAITEEEDMRLNAAIDRALAEGFLSSEQHKALYKSVENAYRNHRQIARRKCQNEGYVSVTAYRKEDMPDIVGCIRDAIDRGFKPCDIAILTRTKRETYQIVDILLASQHDITDERYRVDIMTEEALLIANSPAVRFIIATMRLAIEPTAAIDRAIYNQTLHNDFLHEIDSHEQQIFESLQNCSAEEAFEIIIMQYGDKFASQTVYIEALHEAIIRYCSNKSSDLQMFLKWWDEHAPVQSVANESNERSIEIMTIHKAKGLEKKVVLIPFCDWSLNPKSGTTIWAKAADDSPLADAGYYPVGFAAKLCDSPFANAYYTELVYSHIESLNLLYVALTRAAEELHIFMEQPSLKSLDSDNGEESTDDSKQPYGRVNAMLYDCHLFHFPKESLDSEEPLRFTYGKAIGAEPFKERESLVKIAHLAPYASSPIVPTLATNSSRYTEDNVSLSPRDKGILLHKALEQSLTAEDVFTALRNAHIDGAISAEEYNAIKANITTALSQSPVGEWFDGSWQSIRNEQSIIDPALGVKRPDRVMINGNRAMVVDYKFGERRSAHSKQIAEYGELLRKLGYDDVRGYVWYLREGIIDEISI